MQSQKNDEELGPKLETYSSKTQPTKSQASQERLRQKIDKLPPHKQSALLGRALAQVLPKLLERGNGSGKSQ
ncbi:MAG: hypothetical protein JNL67_07775 [Planctomycetaceae bacterium]|nr:hypothetical protein [Planctomycetaceae bacterium]